MLKTRIRSCQLLLAIVFICSLSGCNLSAPPQPTTTTGIDVSRYQGDIDWKQVHQSDITFAIAKATQGSTYVDPTFSKNSAGMDSVGITRGAYHFLTANEPGDVQARHFLSVAKLERGDLLPVIDIERIGDHSGAELVEIIFEFRDAVMRQTGYEIILYLSPAFWNDHLKSHIQKALTNPLWIAEYEVAEPQSLSKISPWSIWQHSNTVSCDGITGHVDLNIARNIESIRIP